MSVPPSSSAPLKHRFLDLSRVEDTSQDPLVETKGAERQLAQLILSRLITENRWVWYLGDERNQGFPPPLLASFLAKSMGFIKPRIHRVRAEKLRKFPKTISPWSYGYCLPLELDVKKHHVKTTWPDAKKELANPIFKIEEFHIPAPVHLPEELVSHQNTGRFLRDLDYSFYQNFVEKNCLEDIFETITRQAEYQPETVDLLLPELVGVCFDSWPNFYEVIVQLIEFGYKLSDIAAAIMVLPDDAKKEAMRNW